MKIPRSPVKAGLLSIAIFAAMSVIASLAVEIGPDFLIDWSSVTVTTTMPSDNTTD